MNTSRWMIGVAVLFSVSANCRGGTLMKYLRILRYLLGSLLLVATVPVQSASVTFALDFEPFTPGIQSTLTTSAPVGTQIRIHATVTESGGVLQLAHAFVLSVDRVAGTSIDVVPGALFAGQAALLPPSDPVDVNWAPTHVTVGHNDPLVPLSGGHGNLWIPSLSHPTESTAGTGQTGMINQDGLFGFFPDFGSPLTYFLFSFDVTITGPGSTTFAIDPASNFFACVEFGGCSTPGTPFGDNFSFTFLPATIHVVPIPAAVWLFGSGLLGLIGISRRKKAA